MRTKLRTAFIVLAWIAGLHQATAQSARFFRISGPAATAITTFRPDGTLVWSNALAGTNYTIQTVSSLPGETNWVSYVQIPATNSISTNLIVAFYPPAGMVLIPAGVFTMGATLDAPLDDYPTNIYVSAFYMDVNLVNSNQWAGVYNYATNHGYTFADTGAGKAANHPVHTVDWFDCVKWCNARSVQAGLTPVYYTNADFTQVFTNGEYGPTVYANWSANGYRLPTEAEWEKAARGGLSGQRFPWGDTISESVANYYGDTNYSYDLGPNGYNTNFFSGVYPNTSPVGSFAANGYGLYDMAGNAWEWCWDWYGIPYGRPTNTNPTGPATGSERVLRGGNSDGYAYLAQCAYRTYGFPGTVGTLYGFRCVRGL
jgi:sulfatase modifying factor 1